MSQWWFLVCSIILGIISLLITIVFCFWFIYLLETIRLKWKFYRNALKCLLQGDSDNQQRSIVYNAKTELVKNVFLFFLNIVEWIAFIFARIAYALNFTLQYSQHDDINEDTYQNRSQESFFAVLNISSSNIQISLSAYSFLFLPNNLLVLSLTLVASLCMYLAARNARKSWITSKYIPHLICFFSFCMVAIQILATFCSIHIFVDWCNIVLVTVSLIIAFKQYMKLRMVINWTIVDLSITRRTNSLAKQVKMRQKFIRFFTLIWIGTFMLVSCEYLRALLHTLVILFRSEEVETFSISLCDNTYFLTPAFNDILAVLFFGKFLLGVVAASFIFIPYIGYGLSTMCIMLWRLFRGKTGYKTHYHNEIYAPLI